MVDTGACDTSRRANEGSTIARRTFLRAATLATGAGLLSESVEGTAGKTTKQPLETAVHTGPSELNTRPFVVYRAPERDERTICTAQVSWRHRVVVPPRSADREAIYTDLYAANRYPAGSVLELVDRLSACPQEEGTLIFLRRVASPGK